LAPGWLGYGKNPGFYQQPLPVSALPAFAAAQARELSAGPQIRGQIISRALAQIPPDATRVSNNDPNVARAKKPVIVLRAARTRRRGSFPERRAAHASGAQRP